MAHDVHIRRCISRDEKKNLKVMWDLAKIAIVSSNLGLTENKLLT